ncbi:prepilin-type N-terminal cleavage/methylation domain-containing protein [Longibaculum muris]|uniref:prepilin-type N-terminal cleavage/methylation domain-containing protein n=1 Tax=Longibaculum muris TaxID=1796628 RepID=UPI00189DF0FA|nr:prepilin-type N-terminal cleavage/methylation domain-containing protein [Longibaculum muris]
MNIKKLRELKKNKKGFTLVEIIVVVVILAVLMAVTVPSVLSYLNEADNAKYMAQSRAIMSSSQNELIKAYAPDKKIDATEAEAIVTNVNTALSDDGIRVDSLKFCSDSAGATEITDLENKKPTEIASYNVKYTYNGKTINAVIVPNGNIKIVSVN